MPFILYLFLFLSSQAFPCDEGLFKNTQIKIPINSPLANAFSESDFTELINRFRNFYENQFDINFYWESDTLNAVAEKDDQGFSIKIHGGLARHQLMTLDVFTLTLCHELGHDFGGYPKKPNKPWSSAEGQADYYATTKCLRQFWGGEDNAAVIKDFSVPQIVASECKHSFPSEAGQSLCKRISMASMNAVLMFQEIEHIPYLPRFETPDPRRTFTIKFMHPSVQCRLDTLFQGSLCPVSESIGFDDQNEVAGACHESLGDKRGLRPLCWFIPGN